MVAQAAGVHAALMLPGFLGMVIAVERLELTRLTPRHAVAVPLLPTIVGVLLAGAALSPSRPLQYRRLQTQGLPSYTNAPGRWSARSLPPCEETGHG